MEEGGAQGRQKGLDALEEVKNNTKNPREMDKTRRIRGLPAATLFVGVCTLPDESGGVQTLTQYEEREP